MLSLQNAIKILSFVENICIKESDTSCIQVQKSQFSKYKHINSSTWNVIYYGTLEKKKKPFFKIHVLLFWQIEIRQSYWPKIQDLTPDSQCQVCLINRRKGAAFWHYTPIICTPYTVVIFLCQKLSNPHEIN